jgi:ATP-dependent DNA ligase
MAERTGIQLCYPFDENRLKKWQPPYIVQPKLDGERCRAIIDHGEVTLLSSSGAEIVSVPHIKEELSQRFTNSKFIELDGELYHHGASFEDISSIVSRTVNLHPTYDYIEFHVFDIVNTEPQIQRTLELNSLLSTLEMSHTRLVDSLIAENFDDIMRGYDRIVSSEYEGIIVRNFMAPYIRRRSTYVMKFKPKKDDYYTIIGNTQMVDKDGKPKDMLGSLICLSNNCDYFPLEYLNIQINYTKMTAIINGIEYDIFSVGSGMIEEFRRKWWPVEKANELIGKICHIKYQHLTDRKVPRFPVFIEIIDPMEVTK